MRNILNPRWIFILNTVPTLLLFLIYAGEYNIIKSLLSAENIVLWKAFGLGLALLGTLNLLYAVFVSYRGKMVSPAYGLLALTGYIPFLYLYGYHFSNIIPFNIPQWMMPESMALYMGTFLMPTLAYSLFVLVSHFTPTDQHPKAWKSFLAAVAIPISWYVFSQLIIPFWRPVDTDFGMHATIIFILIGTLLFLFFLIRSIYILGLRKAEAWQPYQLAWKIPIAILFPLLGLALNNGHLSSQLRVHAPGVFGDFSAPWFYILAVLNGTLVCLPNLENEWYRLTLFIGRSITFAYTTYFFMVFLPFLPFSVIAILALGSGVLMLTPLALFTLHIHELSKDIVFLKKLLPSNVVPIVSFCSFLVIPLVITLTYLEDKKVLNQGLEYVYQPDYSQTYDIDSKSLQRTLAVINKHKERSNDFIFGSQTPYLSSYFNWLVLDNLTLSDAKINMLERVFSGQSSFEIWPEQLQNDSVSISKISSRSNFDSLQQTWRTWVDLEITNENTIGRRPEYATSITLPTGCWISDYYLYVGERQEMGMLAEKKSAMWIFSQIRNENRDPGILYYLTGNKVAFRVFPFARSETRKTGIEFIHKEPVTLTIDGHNIPLGDTTVQVEMPRPENSLQNVRYVSAKEKANLSAIQRKPYYHFMVDVSKGKQEKMADYTQVIKTLLDKQLIPKEGAKVSFVNAYTSTFALDDQWQQHFSEQSFTGGFYVDLAIRSALVKAYQSKESSYPIFVLVTNHMYSAIFQKDFADLRFAYPESDLFYHLAPTGTLTAHSLYSAPPIPLALSPDLTGEHPVLAFPDAQNPSAFLADNQEASIVLQQEQIDIDPTQIKEKNWATGLYLAAQSQALALHPETAEQAWRPLVRHSFGAHIMTPVTSFLVVENDAQKAMLQKKQAQALSGNSALDLGEDAQRMSEPNFFVLAILLGFFFWIRRRKRHQLTRSF
ncbi:MAG: MSEP-CTERM sorting domain-containing protein [Saprospiraceae bacterium]